MLLRMPCPTARKGTRNLWFYERIPADVVRILQSLPTAIRPKGWGKQFVWLPLGTPDPQEAKARCAAVSAQYLADLKRIRETKPEELSAETINALQNEAAMMAEGMLPAISLKPTPDDPVPTIAGRMLAAHGALATPKSLQEATQALNIRLNEHAQSMAPYEKRRAAGDYGAIPPVIEGKTLSDVRKKESKGKGLRLSKLVHAFKTTPRIATSQTSEATFSRYDTPLSRLVSFLGDPIAASVTADDLRRFRHEQQTKGVTDANRLSRLNTVNSVDMAAIKSLFGWASNPDEHDPTTGPLISENPAQGIKIKTKIAMGVTGKEQPGFFDHEWRSILSAASQIIVGNEEPERDRAKRWVPWIAAYTGRRITSISGLTFERFVTLQGVECMVFPPEKGVPKTSYVPVHPHLIEMGLLDMVKAIGKGPLFHPAKQGPNPVTEAIRRWVRQVVGIKRVEAAPNHAWRSTFITIANDPVATDGAIPEAHVCYFTGHSIRGKGVSHQFYDRPPLSSLAASMARFPRYDLRV